MNAVLISDLVFGFAIVVWGVREYITIQNKVKGDTFSERTRHYFRIHTKTGAWVFLAAWGLLAAWYPAHIILMKV